MNIYYHISSVTGNTLFLANAVLAGLESQGHTLQRTPAGADLMLLFFWCRKGSMDPKSLALVDTLPSGPVIALGTMGYYPDSEYGNMVREQVASYINKIEGLSCLGVFTCQGRIPAEKTERRRALPPTSKHYLDDEGYRRHLEARNHPNEEDCKDAIRFLHGLLPDESSVQIHSLT